MAKAIAPNGILYAVDIDPKMLDYVAERAKKAGVTNLRTVLGLIDDPELPVKDLTVSGETPIMSEGSSILNPPK
jgi:ubiquinone/menaquinone biosynthesis C-methylase UbiE